MKITLNEINLWIDNDESLYLWHKRSRLSKREFVKQNKAELVALIDRVVNKPPPEKTWRDY